MRDLGGRLFLAVDLSEALRRGLTEHLARHLPQGRLPGRAVKPDLWHLTLEFLGEVASIDAGRLMASLSAAELGPEFELGFDRLGAFPRAERARVLWLGCARGADALAGLAEAARSAARAAGFAGEPRAFSAHLTLSRLRPPVDLRDLIEAVPAFDGRMRVASLELYRSHLGRAGARYERLGHWPLASSSEAWPRAIDDARTQDGDIACRT